MNRFICHDDNMWEDSWTYGDWHQYLCKLPDSSIVCAKLSAIPVVGMVLGVCLTLLGAYLGNLVMSVGILFIAPFIWLALSSYNLMVVVGPKQTNGMRIYPWEALET